MKNLLIENKLFDEELVNDSVVYKFTYPEGGCHASYIDYIETEWENTVTESLKEHMNEDHLKET